MKESSQYEARFLNQYAKIPEMISETLTAVYPTEYESVRHCVGLIIVNLLEHGEIAYSRNKNFYSANKTRYYTFASMLRALDIAVAEGYAIGLQMGTLPRNFKKGMSSMLGVGPRLGEFSMPGEMELDVESLPLLSVDDRPVFGQEDLSFVKERCAKMSSGFNPFIPALNLIYDEALTLNRDYWNKMVIDARNTESKQKCFSRVGLTRIFNDGLMGRWFQKGEMSYQQLPEGERAKLLINGERVTEIDYSAMHPHILYAWEGRQCPADFYQRIVNQCGCSRFIAKSITLIAINASSYVSLVGAININKLKQQTANKNRAIPEPVLYNELKKQNLMPKEVVEAIKMAHPVIEKYIYRALANKLMLVESDIMTSVLLKLMRLGISALPIHDSVIVRSQHEVAARRVMQDTYKEHTGFSAVIK